MSYRWKVSDLNFIRANMHLTDYEIGFVLGVSEYAVKRARQRNGIMKGSHANQRGNPNGNIQNLKPRGGFKSQRIAA